MWLERLKIVTIINLLEKEIGVSFPFVEVLVNKRNEKKIFFMFHSETVSQLMSPR